MSKSFKQISLFIGSLIIILTLLQVPITPSTTQQSLVPIDRSPLSSKIQPPIDPSPNAQPQKTIPLIPSPQPSTTNQPNQLLRFQNEQTKQQFIDQNNLSADILKPIPLLNTYSLQAINLILNTGTQNFINQRYNALLTPSDPLRPNQWHHLRTNTQTAWNHQTGSPSVTIAVLDTGFGLNISDLTSAWQTNPGEIGPTILEGMAPNCTSRGLLIDKSCNNIDDDNDSYTDNHLGWNFTTNTNDVSARQLTPNSNAVYHGTAVASLAAARTNNGIGGSGVSWNSKILPIQVLDDNGDGDTISVALGIRYAVDHGANIINLSLGTSADDPLVSEQIDYAIEHGVVIVAASGNDGCDCVSYPARYPSVIAVGATNAINGLAGFSSYGSNLDLVAPGVNLCSTIWTSAATTGLNTCGLNGTSFSSPLVAGTIALLLSQNPTLTPAQINNALTSTATKLTPMGGANFTKYYGYGLLNTLSALNDVSATSSLGSPISVSLISLSQLDKALDGYEYDKFNSTCTSYTSDVLCTTRAINQQTNQIVIITPDFNPIGTRSLQQDLYGANLSTGTWIIQNYLTTTSGIQSMAQEKIITITN